MQRWTIIEWDLYHPVHEALMKLPFVPVRVAMDPKVHTPMTLVTLKQLGAAVNAEFAGSLTMLPNPARSEAGFLWLIVDTEIDPEDLVVTHEHCGRVAHDPLLMQAVTDAVQAPLLKACKNMAQAIRHYENTLAGVTLRPGQDPMAMIETRVLVKTMTHELQLALQDAGRAIQSSQSDVPAATTTGSEVRRKGKILLYLGLGLAGVALAVASLAMGPVGVAAIVLASIGLYRGVLDTAKAFITHLESAARVRKRLVQALEGYQGGLRAHGPKAFLAAVANVALKSNVMQVAWGGGPLASLSDVAEDIDEYESLVNIMRAHLAQLSEGLLAKMDAIQTLEREGSLVRKEVSFARKSPEGGDLEAIKLERSKEELALDKLLVRIENQYQQWSRDMADLGPLRDLARKVLQGADSAVWAEKLVDAVVNAGLTIASARVDPPSTATDWAGLVVDVTGQALSDAELLAEAAQGDKGQPGKVADRYGSGKGSLRSA